jgi:hypothetical protein
MMMAERADRLTLEASTRTCTVNGAQSIPTNVLNYAAGTLASPVGFTTGMVSTSEDGEAAKMVVGEILGHNGVGLVDM